MAVFERVFAWSGGVAFVVSLILCAWLYLAVLGRFPDAPPSSTRALVDVALFTAFALHHSVFARERVQRAIAALVPEPLIRPVYVWTASLLLIVLCVLWQPIGGEAYAAHGAIAAVLVGAQAGGVWLIARSVRAIDPLELAGIHPPARGADAQPLQTGGPYGIVRHPLYLGWIVAVFGHPHMTMDRLAFAAITTIYLLAAIPLEERSLGRAFGDAYARYRRRVRWRVIPFVY